MPLSRATASPEALLSFRVVVRYLNLNTIPLSNKGRSNLLVSKIRRITIAIDPLVYFASYRFTNTRKFTKTANKLLASLVVVTTCRTKGHYFSHQTHYHGYRELAKLDASESLVNGKGEINFCLNLTIANWDFLTRV